MMGWSMAARARRRECRFAEATHSHHRAAHGASWTRSCLKIAIEFWKSARACSVDPAVCLPSGSSAPSSCSARIASTSSSVGDGDLLGGMLSSRSSRSQSDTWSAALALITSNGISPLSPAFTRPPAVAAGTKLAIARNVAGITGAKFVPCYDKRQNETTQL